MMKRLDENLPESTVGGVYRPLVVHVVRQFWPNRGGLEDVVLNLCRQALRRGFRIRVVTLNSLFSDPSLVLADREMIDGIEVVRIPWKGTSRYPVAPSVLQHIRDADLVHVHAIDFFFDFLAATKLVHGRKMIATTHGGFFHTKRFAAIKAVWFQTLTRFSASRYRFLVGCSQSDVDTFRPIASRNLELIENGADTLKFQGLAPTSPVKRLISIGRFSFNKRLDRLVDMMRALVAIDPDWSLDLVGVQSDLSTAEVKALTTGIEANVRVHTGLSNADVGGLIAENSIFVSASEYEGFGLVAIEAMSAGLLPVLETNTAYEALASKHKPIRLGDFSDASKAAKVVVEAWTRLSADPARVRSDLLATADQYSWDEVSKRYLRLYDIALSRDVTQTA